MITAAGAIYKRKHESVAHVIMDSFLASMEHAKDNARLASTRHSFMAPMGESLEARALVRYSHFIVFSLLLSLLRLHWAGNAVSFLQLEPLP